MNPYLGTILMVAFNFAPRGWALCDGQLLPIAQNAALFNLLGTFYGGDGKTTFALPNLNGSLPLCMGQAPGFSPSAIGQTGSVGGGGLDVIGLPGAHPSPAVRYLTVNFIIALEGIYPQEN